MDLRSLRYFVAVAEALSFSRAADKLHRTQPGLSRAIRELESELGVELFDRVGRHVVLRPEGGQMLERARLLLREADRFIGHAKLLASGKKRVLRVGGASNTLERVLPPILRSYGKQWSEVDVQLRAEGGSAVLAALERGELDVAIARATNSDILESRIVFPIHLVALIARGHRLARLRKLEIAELEFERILVPPASFTSRMLLDSAFLASNITPVIALESHDLNTLLALAEAQQGIALTPSTVNVTARNVVVLPILLNSRPVGSAVGLIWGRQRVLAPHVAAFIEVAARHLRRDFPGKHLRLPRLSGLE